MPTKKKLPGARDLEAKSTTPELSVAVGSIQVTVVPGVPISTFSNTLSKQAITGGVPSTVNGVNKVSRGGVITDR